MGVGRVVCVCVCGGGGGGAGGGSLFSLKTPLLVNNYEGKYQHL